MARCRRALVARAARSHHPLHALFDHRFDGGLVRCRAKIAAPRLEAHDVATGCAGKGHLGREALELHELAVGEHPAEVAVEQHDAVDHVVEHRLEDFPCSLRLGTCFLGALLGFGQLGFALLGLADVGDDGDGAAVRRAARRDATPAAGSDRDLDTGFAGAVQRRHARNRLFASRRIVHAGNKAGFDIGPETVVECLARRNGLGDIQHHGAESRVADQQAIILVVDDQGIVRCFQSVHQQAARGFAFLAHGRMTIGKILVSQAE